MSITHEFFQNFLKNHVSFFTRPLPPTEMEFDMGYCLARENWVDIKREIDQLHVPSDLFLQLNQLFELAHEFIWLLKGSNDDYSVLIFRLQSEWRKVQEAAKSLPRH